MTHAQTKIKERPILFSGPMVCAILEGRKTQTRRVVKGMALDWLAPDLFTPEFVADPDNSLCPYGKPGDKDWKTGLIPQDGWYNVDDLTDQPEIPVYLRRFQDGGEWHITWGWDESDDPEAIEMDGGPTTETIRWKRPGDRLWVRETWANLNADFPTVDPYFVYRADSSDHGPVTWKPSIHMPRAASRILLEITDVRVERLQDISEDDARAEGIEMWPDGNFKAYTKQPGKFTYARDSFRTLWESINGPESWEANPWVWVVNFKTVKP